MKRGLMMAVTDNLSRQHGEILDLAAQIKALMRKNPPPVNEIGQLLPVLAGKLSIHLAMEDNALYPIFFKSGLSKVRQIAGDYCAEMGNLKKTFSDYIQNWADDQKIELQFEEFRQETQKLLMTLQQRIEREDYELYKLMG